MIPKFTIARIKEEARIDEVVGEFVTLKKRGSSLLGLCPFHNEKTPSFNVSVAKGIYKCFGCGKAGDSVSFLMEAQQMSYVEALRFLAKKYNIEIVEEHVSDERRKEEEEKQSHTESILIANAFAQRFFTDYMLHREEGRIGLAYFKERGFSKAIIEKFQLGFAPETGSALTDEALKQGYQLQILKDAGLTSPKENSKYDFFRNRVMFPIHNVVGKVIAFGGRIMVKDDKLPKYVNTPESEVYVKSKILYGIAFAKNEIRKLDECLLVEGYTDVISLFQSGIENVVASSGTSLTVDQIKLIKRFTNNITMLYDGDKAGIKAALRGTDMILEEGLNVRVVILPDNEDPDSFVRKEGAEALRDFLKYNRKDLILFKSSLFAEEAKHDPIKRAELTRDMVQSISKVPDNIQRSVYIKECAIHMGLSEQLLITEVNKIRRLRLKEKFKEEVAPEQITIDERQEQQVHGEQMKEDRASVYESLEREIVRLLMECGTWEIYIDAGHTETSTQFVLDDLEGIEFKTKYKLLFDLIRNDFQKGEVHDTDYFLHHENPEIAALARDLLVSKYELSEGWWKRFEVRVPGKREIYTKEITSDATHLKNVITLEQIEEINRLIKEEKDEEKLTQLLKMQMTLTQQKKEFMKWTGSVIPRNRH
ncbi:MAG: DNA primase [Chitinophagales bacterium]